MPRREGLYIVGAIAALAVLLGLIGGVVYFVVDLVRSAGVNSADANIRIEAELIPQAVMATQEPGQWVFKPGPEPLLVLSRIESAYGYSGDQDAAPTHVQPTFIERVWIPIPAKMSVGIPIQFNPVNQHYQYGYDAGRYDEGLRTKPADLAGQVTVLGVDDDWLIAQVDLEVVPVDAAAWRVDETLIVPVEPKGVHATAFNPGGPAVAPPTSAAAEIPDQSKVPAEMIGRWFAQVMRDAPEIAVGAQAVVQDVYLELGDDRRCVLATVGAEAAAPPGMKYGSYRVVDNWLIMTVKKYVYDKPRDNNHLAELAGIPLIVLRIDWDNQDLLLSGDFRPPISGHLAATPGKGLRFKRRDLPDLRAHRPKAGRMRGFEERPEPASVNPRFGSTE